MRLPLPHRNEALLAAAVVVLGQVELWTDANLADDRARLLPLITVGAAALAWRVAAPLLPLTVLVGLGAILDATADGDEDDPMAFVLALLIALYSVGAHTAGWRFAVGAALASLGTTVAIATDHEGGFTIANVLFYVVILGGPWLGGVAIRRRRLSERSLASRAQVLEQEGSERARRAVADERARIARELHDVVAHGISVMVLQARGGRRALDTDAGLARGAFDAIEQSGRESLAEMRRLLDMLRRDDDELALAPQPTLRRIDALVAQVTEAGLPVTLEVEGEAHDLPPGVDLSAYRIVQEALTNALRHAGPATARVRIRYAADGVELEIADTGHGAVRTNGGGHGLVGMRERARLYGGEVQTEEATEGGFRVRARLPLDATR